MTNKEFYSDKLLATSLRNACINLHKLVFDKPCQEKNCCDCEFSTVENVENWLNAEHVEPEPPILENGDGLKTGDLIMVRDDDEPWTKVQFLAYIDGVFYTREPMIGGTFMVKVYLQARLPMEGE